MTSLLKASFDAAAKNNIGPLVRGGESQPGGVRGAGGGGAGGVGA